MRASLIACTSWVARPPGFAVAGLLIVAVAAGPASARFAHAAAPAAPPASIEVEVRGGRLSVNLRDAPLDEVLHLIAAQAGIDVNLRGDLGGPVTRAFTDLPLEEGIRRLVRGHSVSFEYTRSRGGAPRLTEIWVLASSPGAPKPRPVAPVDRASRFQAVGALAARGDSTAPAELARILAEDADPQVRARAAGALGHMAQASSAGPLKAALADEAPAVRIQAIWGLLRIEREGVVDALAGVLSGDPDPGVRRVAVRALGSLRVEAAAAALRSAAADSDASVRAAATTELARWERSPFGPGPRP